MASSAGRAAEPVGRPPAVQLGLLWGAAAGATAAVAFGMPSLAARAVRALPPCPVKTLVGLPCPACGSGRASAALAGLDLPAALAANPLFTLAALAFLAGGAVALGLALAGKGVTEPRTLSVPVRVALVLGVAANWTWLVLDGR